jgi:formate hydrogenlyase subunit 4
VLIYSIIGFFVFIQIAMIENSRLPVDDPKTHLELTMIHEVMILDNSGPGLALMEYAAALKLWLFSLMIGRIIVPVSCARPVIHTLVVFGLVAAGAVAVGIVESVMARTRLIKVPLLLFGAGVVALLGFFVSVTGALSW